MNTFLDEMEFMRYWVDKPTYTSEKKKKKESSIEVHPATTRARFSATFRVEQADCPAVFLNST